MTKDPCVLVYLDKWIAGTNGMKSSFRAWYMDLLFYQHDNGFIPEDEDEIAGICRVRPSEYDLFKQMLEQVLNAKFKKNEKGWYNEVAAEILTRRSVFKDKRSKSGDLGVIIKLAKSIEGFDNQSIAKLKEELKEKTKEELQKYKDKQVLKQMLKLYIDVIVIKDINKDKGVNEKSEKFTALEILADDEMFLESAILMRHKISKEKLFQMLEQFSLKLEGDDTFFTKLEIGKARALFQKWCNTWMSNEKSKAKSNPATAKILEQLESEMS